jgi:hypothetical protein
MRDFWDFLGSFWRTLVLRITGGLLAVFLAAWAFFGSAVPPAWVFWSALAVYFFVSAFVIWQKERRRAEVAEGPFNSEIEARVAEEMPKLDDFQLGLVKKMALPTKVVPSGFDEQKVMWALANAGVIWSADDRHYEIQAVYLQPIQRWLKTH